MSSYTEMYKKYLNLGDSLKQGDEDMKRFEQVMTDYRSGPINRGPVEFMDNVFCGSKENARDVDVLRRLRITHVLNCAGSRKSSTTPNNPYSQLDSGVQGYLELDAKDEECFPIIRIFYTQAKSFIDAAMKSGGKVMVHCELGMNRSVTLCLAYQLESNKCKLFQAVKDFLSIRPNILTNRGFRRQLLEFATDRKLI